MNTRRFDDLVRHPFCYSPIILQGTTEISAYCENHNVIKGFLCCDIEMEDFEIPVSMLGKLQLLLAYKFTGRASKRFLFDNRYRKLVSVLSCVDPPAVKRNSEQIFRILLNDEQSFCEVKTLSGITYYGGHGLICDCEMNPLLLYTCHIKNIVIEEQSLFPADYNKKAKVTIDKYILRVDPSVFKRKDMLSKNIISKLIPALNWDTNSINVSNAWVYSEVSKPIVIVEKINGFVYKPVEPFIPSIMNEDINSFLQTSVIAEEIVDSI